MKTGEPMNSRHYGNARRTKTVVRSACLAAILAVPVLLVSGPAIAEELCPPGDQSPYGNPCPGDTSIVLPLTLLVVNPDFVAQTDDLGVGECLANDGANVPIDSCAPAPPKWVGGAAAGGAMGNLYSFNAAPGAYKVVWCTGSCVTNAHITLNAYRNTNGLESLGKLWEVQVTNGAATWADEAHWTRHDTLEALMSGQGSTWGYACPNSSKCS
jgi:hypothetical protein